MRSLLILGLLLNTLHAATSRIALLPSFASSEAPSGTRIYLEDFDQVLKAEILRDWNTEMVRRTGLSEEVFAEAENPKPKGRVIPADFLISSVLESSANSLRVVIAPTDGNPATQQSKTFTFQTVDRLAETLPAQISAYFGEVAGLEKRGTATPAEAADRGAPLKVALLAPTTTDPEPGKLTEPQPLFRMMLEQILGGKDAPITLIPEDQDPSSADLYLTPMVHALDGDQVRFSLFLHDPISSRWIAGRSWQIAGLEVPPSSEIREMLSDPSIVSGFSDQPISDNPEKRHAEVKTLKSWFSSIEELREDIESKAHLAQTLADAALALSHDDPKHVEKMIDTFLVSAFPNACYPQEVEFNPHQSKNFQIAQLKSGGRIQPIIENGVRIMEGPIQVILKNPNDDQIRLAAIYFLLSEQPEKARQVIESRGLSVEEIGKNQTLMFRYAQALVAVGAYEEAFNFIKQCQPQSRNLYSGLVEIGLDVLRADQRFADEFTWFWNGQSWMDEWGIDRLIRFLNLGCEQDRAADALQVFAAEANQWDRSSSDLMVPIVRTKIAAGQKDAAISSAQCAWLASRRKGDEANMTALANLLDQLGAKPLQKLVEASDFLRFPQGTFIEFLHDPSIDGAYAAETARQLANFWGCEVRVKSVDVDFKQFKSYDSSKQSVNGADVVSALAKLATDSDQRLSTVFLTGIQLRSESRNYVGRIYSTSESNGTFNLISDYFTKEFKDYDARPLPEISAVACGEHRLIESMLVSLSENSPEGTYIAMPPEVFAPNGNLTLTAMELGIAPSTGKLLSRLDPVEILQHVREAQQEYIEELESSDNDPDQSYVEEIESRVSETKLTIIKPS